MRGNAHGTIRLILTKSQADEVCRQSLSGLTTLDLTAEQVKEVVSDLLMETAATATEAVNISRTLFPDLESVRD